MDKDRKYFMGSLDELCAELEPVHETFPEHFGIALSRSFSKAQAILSFSAESV